MAYVQNPGRGNNAKTGHGIPSPFKQSAVDSKVEAMIANKKKKDAEAAAAKGLKIRTEAEGVRDLYEKGLKFDATEMQAKKDSATVDNKLRKAGLNFEAGKMGNAKANETRKAGNPWSDADYPVLKDAATGKYKMTRVKKGGK